VTKIAVTLYKNKKRCSGRVGIMVVESGDKQRKEHLSCKRHFDFAKVHGMRSAGMTWKQIAEQIGYSAGHISVVYGVAAFHCEMGWKPWPHSNPAQPAKQDDGD
jgi:hypothetical protein